MSYLVLRFLGCYILTRIFTRILSLGPVFKVQAEASGNIDIGVDVTVAMQYKAENAKAFFPPSSNFPNGGGFSQTAARKLTASFIFNLIYKPF